MLVDGLQTLMAEYKGGIIAANENPNEWHLWLLENIGQQTIYEQRFEQQKKVMAELANIWAFEGIQMMVFKGQANASYYPVPNHRATGDIDCWLFGEAEKGDKIMKQRGAVVDNKWYRHSKISYHGETIENHRVMSHTRGDREKKEMEVKLRSMLNPKDLSMIDGCGKAMMPSPQLMLAF